MDPPVAVGAGTSEAKESVFSSPATFECQGEEHRRRRPHPTDLGPCGKEFRCQVQVWRGVWVILPGVLAGDGVLHFAVPIFCGPGDGLQQAVEQE